MVSDTGDFGAGWNVEATNNNKIVSASGNVCSNTLCEADEVIGEDAGPDVLFWPLYELAIFQVVAGHLVDEIVGRARGIVGHEGDRWLGRVVCFRSYEEACGVGVAGACGGVTDRDVAGC